MRVGFGCKGTTIFRNSQYFGETLYFINTCTLAGNCGGPGGKDLAAKTWRERPGGKKGGKGRGIIGG